MLFNFSKGDKTWSYFSCWIQAYPFYSLHSIVLYTFGFTRQSGGPGAIFTPIWRCSIDLDCLCRRIRHVSVYKGPCEVISFTPLVILHHKRSPCPTLPPLAGKTMSIYLEKENYQKKKLLKKKIKFSPKKLKG